MNDDHLLTCPSRRTFASRGCLVVRFGCRQAATNTPFSAGKYQNTYYGYSYDTNAGPLNEAEWTLDNYQVGPDGVPSSLKHGETAKVQIDANDDGRYESTGSYPSTDLRYVNLKDDGAIAVRTIPVSADLREKDLELLLRRWVDSMSGQDAMTLYIQSQQLRLGGAQTHSSRIVSHAPGKLSGYEAHYARVEVANIEQMKLDPNHREALIDVVLARTDYVWSAAGGALFPVYFFATYRDHPDFFDRHAATFEAFLKQLSLAGPPQLPEKLASLCKMPNVTTHLHFGNKPNKRDSTSFEVTSLEPLDEEIVKCLSERGTPLRKVTLPPERFRLYVHRPTRTGDDTAIPNLNQAALTGESVEPRAPAPETAAAPAPEGAAVN